MKKLNWGMIGGGHGSQIGPAHRLAAGLDGHFTFAAGALDHDPEAGRDNARRLGVAADRAYGDWREMLEDETNRSDRVDLVTVATPNSTHFEISKAFLQAGFNVLCEKPMTVTEAEAEDLVLTARKAGCICAVNYGYTGYALVRHMRAMVGRGDLGKIRLVVAEFAHGHHANAADADNPRVRWRYDPAEAGVSAQFADCGIHALHIASFVTGQEVMKLSADFASCLPGRGMPLAFGNIYRDLAESLLAARENRTPDPAVTLFPRAEDGLRSIAAIHAAVASAKQDGAWVDARPRLFR